MEERRIVWDENKNAENKLKHKIGFEDAQFAFADPDRIERIDRSESNISGETRWQGRQPLVCCLYGVWEAEKHERRSYNGYYRINGKGWTKDS
ncbi:MAG: BrnT family toxin [Treponema sp.]|nr:BrnT family toxin [Treponema sp.]